MKNVLTIILTTLVTIWLIFPVNANVYKENILLAEQWEVSRSGEALINVPVINKVIKQWSLKPDQKIELHYPGGEEGELWVGELHDWLVSLGIPSNNISIVPGSGVEDVIRLHVVKIGESYR